MIRFQFFLLLTLAFASPVFAAPEIVDGNTLRIDASASGYGASMRLKSASPAASTALNGRSATRPPITCGRSSPKAG
ncbi:MULTISPECIES: hypothetical protein [unclassified Inquilinus]|uniref:hypothetical protein n=1 Tax=unclassified Inquilinus TaxID=2645927 RepID=UPI003F8F6CCF